MPFHLTDTIMATLILSTIKLTLYTFINKISKDVKNVKDSIIYSEEFIQKCYNTLLSKNIGDSILIYKIMNYIGFYKIIYDNLKIDGSKYAFTDTYIIASIKSIMHIYNEATTFKETLDNNLMSYQIFYAIKKIILEQYRSLPVIDRTKDNMDNLKSMVFALKDQIIDDLKNILITLSEYYVTILENIDIYNKIFDSIKECNPTEIIFDQKSILKNILNIFNPTNDKNDERGKQLLDKCIEAIKDFLISNSLTGALRTIRTDIIADKLTLKNFLFIPFGEKALTAPSTTLTIYIYKKLKTDNNFNFSDNILKCWALYKILAKNLAIVNIDENGNISTKAGITGTSGVDGISYTADTIEEINKLFAKDDNGESLSEGDIDTMFDKIYDILDTITRDIFIGKPFPTDIDTIRHVFNKKPMSNEILIKCKQSIYIIEITNPDGKKEKKGASIFSTFSLNCESEIEDLSRVHFFNLDKNGSIDDKSPNYILKIYSDTIIPHITSTPIDPPPIPPVGATKSEKDQIITDTYQWDNYGDLDIKNRIIQQWKSELDRQLSDSSPQIDTSTAIKYKDNSTQILEIIKKFIKTKIVDSTKQIIENKIKDIENDPTKLKGYIFEHFDKNGSDLTASTFNALFQQYIKDNPPTNTPLNPSDPTIPSISNFNNNDNDSIANYWNIYKILSNYISINRRDSDNKCIFEYNDDSIISELNSLLLYANNNMFIDYLNEDQIFEKIYEQLIIFSEIILSGFTDVTKKKPLSSKQKPALIANGYDIHEFFTLPTDLIKYEIEKENLNKVYFYDKLKMVGKSPKYLIDPYILKTFSDNRNYNADTHTYNFDKEKIIQEWKSKLLELKKNDKKEENAEEKIIVYKDERYNKYIDVMGDINLFTKYLEIDPFGYSESEINDAIANISDPNKILQIGIEHQYINKIENGIDSCLFNNMPIITDLNTNLYSLIQIPIIPLLDWITTGKKYNFDEMMKSLTKENEKINYSVYATIIYNNKTKPMSIQNIYKYYSDDIFMNIDSKSTVKENEKNVFMLISTKTLWLEIKSYFNSNVHIYDKDDDDNKFVENNKTPVENFIDPYKIQKKLEEITKLISTEEANYIKLLDVYNSHEDVPEDNKLKPLKLESMQAVIDEAVHDAIEKYKEEQASANPTPEQIQGAIVATDRAISLIRQDTQNILDTEIQTLENALIESEKLIETTINTDFNTIASIDEIIEKMKILKIEIDKIKQTRGQLLQIMHDIYFNMLEGICILEENKKAIEDDKTTLAQSNPPLAITPASQAILDQNAILLAQISELSCKLIDYATLDYIKNIDDESIKTDNVFNYEYLQRNSTTLNKLINELRDKKKDQIYLNKSKQSYYQNMPLISIYKNFENNNSYLPKNNEEFLNFIRDLKNKTVRPSVPVLMPTSLVPASVPAPAIPAPATLTPEQQQEFNKLQDEKNALDASNAQLTTSIETLNDAIKKLNDEITELKDEITELKDITIKNNMDKINELESKIAELEFDIAKQLIDINEQIRLNSEKKLEVDDLVQGMINLSVKNKTLKDENDLLQTQIITTPNLSKIIKDLITVLENDAKINTSIPEYEKKELEKIIELIPELQTKSVEQVKASLKLLLDSVSFNDRNDLISEIQSFLALQSNNSESNFETTNYNQELLKFDPVNMPPSMRLKNALGHFRVKYVDPKVFIEVIKDPNSYNDPNIDFIYSNKSNSSLNGTVQNMSINSAQNGEYFPINSELTSVIVV
jgi:hypothetical protein